MFLQNVIKAYSLAKNCKGQDATKMFPRLLFDMFLFGFASRSQIQICMTSFSIRRRGRRQASAAHK